jgi:hypothetical protein
MALLFPISASIGQTYQSGSSNTYEWTGTYWKIKNVINFNAFSASIVNRINAATNEQDLSYLATTGSNQFIGDQSVSSSIYFINGDNVGAIGVAPVISGSGFPLYDNASGDFILASISSDITLITYLSGSENLNDVAQVSLTRSGSLDVYANMMVSGSIIPATANGTYTSSFSLGSATNAWKDLYISHGSIIFVDAVTQATSSFSIDNNAGQDTVKYTAAITASKYFGDGSGLTNLPSTTNWNKDKEYILRNTEQLTFSGDYILEDCALLIEGGISASVDGIDEWTPVIFTNGRSGSVTQTGDNGYILVTPHSDSEASDGVQIQRFFDTETTMSIGYMWSGENVGVDRPYYEVGIYEPTEPNTQSKLQNPNAVSESGTWTINVPSASWLAIGAWTDSDNNIPGTLQLTFPYNPNDDIVRYSANKYFKKEGTIFIGGNLLVKDSTIENNGKISVGGDVILIGNSEITGTGTII